MLAKLTEWISTIPKMNTCKNFSANFFDKNKCQNCFKPRETHLQSDKDLAKVSFVIKILMIYLVNNHFMNYRCRIILAQHGIVIDSFSNNFNLVFGVRIEEFNLHVIIGNGSWSTGVIFEFEFWGHYFEHECKVALLWV